MSNKKPFNKEPSPNIKKFIEYLDHTLKMFDKYVGEEEFEDSNSDIYKLFSTLLNIYNDLVSRNKTKYDVDEKYYYHDSDRIAHEIYRKGLYSESDDVPIIFTEDRNNMDNHNSEWICHDIDKSRNDMNKYHNKNVLMDQSHNDTDQSYIDDTDQSHQSEQSYIDQSHHIHKKTNDKLFEKSGNKFTHPNTINIDHFFENSSNKSSDIDEKINILKKLINSRR